MGWLCSVLPRRCHKPVNVQFWGKRNTCHLVPQSRCQHFPTMIWEKWSLCQERVVSRRSHTIPRGPLSPTPLSQMPHLPSHTRWEWPQGHQGFSVSAFSFSGIPILFITPPMALGVHRACPAGLTRFLQHGPLVPLWWVRHFPPPFISSCCWSSRCPPGWRPLLQLPLAAGAAKPSPSHCRPFKAVFHGHHHHHHHHPGFLFYNRLRTQSLGIGPALNIVLTDDFKRVVSPWPSFLQSDVFLQGNLVVPHRRTLVALRILQGAQMCSHPEQNVI